MSDSISEKTKYTFEVFDSFAEAEAAEREEWMNMDHEERMILLETLRRAAYPDERVTPHRLQRVLSIV